MFRHVVFGDLVRNDGLDEFSGENSIHPHSTAKMWTVNLRSEFPQVCALANIGRQSKLHDAMLAFAVARRWPAVSSNSLEPGWVPTKMGGPGASDDMGQAHLTQAWLASGDDPKSQVTGKYFYHLRRMEPNPQAHDLALQDRLIEICAEISGVTLPT
jgi:hypothetical protein